ncbi:MAG: DUF58 domain-containing protein [Calditrichaeota bacterium]|nr:DUF58 domain-containing protein [Calditrichota bacterium]MCB0302232.1 DUF58 domain-containing protein [Calditrichota bacterium]MCB9087704.1 DUF58 domain-containing protein [Calditrichia bacterium]
METKELLKKVRQIEINIRGVVNEVFAGEYHSVFKGRGMEFAEVREYRYGDDVRNIDWNVSARMSQPFVKMFDEERELTVMILFDCSASEIFGTRGQVKGDVATEIAALLASSALKNNDKVGLIIFSDRIEKFVPPRKGRQHILRVIRELLFAEDEVSAGNPRSIQTDIAVALEYLNQIVKRRATVFLISDFLAEGFEKDLQIANKRHDLVGIRIVDPLEEKLPAVGLIELEDLETGEVLLVDTAVSAIRQSASENAAKSKQKLERFFKSIGMDFIDIYTNESYVRPLTKFFRMRARRFR